MCMDIGREGRLLCVSLKGGLRVKLQRPSFFLRNRHRRFCLPFSERHGACLEAEHLRFFKENFAASPEVQFYVKSLSDKSSLGQSEKTAANRRLAKMRQLVADGDFFSEAAMQARQPALYHEFLGRYTSMPHATHASSPSSSPSSSPVSSSSSTSFLRPFRAPGGSASTQLPAASSPQEPQQNEGKDFFSAHPRSLSSCLLSAMDSRMLRRQVQEERDRWRRQDEELLANIDGGRALKTLREEREARRLQRFLQREEHRERREDEEEESEGIDSDLETEEDEESTDNVNGGHPGVAPAGGKRRRRFVDATTYAQKQDDFLLLMQENFLAGRDAHYIDYKSIDQDEALDDLQEVDRDAEEKYFCGEDEPTETDAEKRPPA
ncbi:hypothetical protein TGGT1_410850 [Toxoplasma gondii GT1]|uniref:CCD97-like C-terminal domain-containing protein n=2 Tax=Toxoplasma gondii TaxID=5811 RepID=S7VV88_TOXGG|nr:hypothetical protein TGGT1_410850 [Toxoplasma gondii GT1]RQX66942.1 hypothetical protein TGCAST_220170B [Toxoplasma gondii CAST]